MHGIVVYLLFAVAAVIFGGVGFLIQAAINKSQKNKWIKFLPAFCLLCWFVSMIIKPVFFFYYVIAGLTLLGMAAALIVSFVKTGKEMSK